MRFGEVPGYLAFVMASASLIWQVVAWSRMGHRLVLEVTFLAEASQPDRKRPAVRVMNKGRGAAQLMGVGLEPGTMALDPVQEIPGGDGYLMTRFPVTIAGGETKFIVFDDDQALAEINRVQSPVIWAVAHLGDGTTVRSPDHKLNAGAVP